MGLRTADPRRWRSHLADAAREVVLDLRAARKATGGLLKIATNVRSILEIVERDAGRQCPICSATFVDFAPFKNRPHSRCPNCNALERQRGTWLYLKQETSLLTGETRMLHVAAEPTIRARISKMVNVEYVPTDYDPDRPEEGVDIQRLPYDDASYDMVLCSHVLEHVPDDRAAMREMCRVLRPGGLAVILVPTRDRAHTYEDPSITTDEGRAKAFGRFDHVRLYGRDVVQRLRDAGFDVAVDYFTDRLPLEQRTRFGLVSEPIFACRKPVAPP
jgi:hypothetical protein